MIFADLLEVVQTATLEVRPKCRLRIWSSSRRSPLGMGLFHLIAPLHPA
jgi:hypothetical protein